VPRRLSTDPGVPALRQLSMDRAELVLHPLSTDLAEPGPHRLSMGPAEPVPRQLSTDRVVQVLHLLSMGLAEQALHLRPLRSSQPCRLSGRESQLRLPARTRQERPPQLTSASGPSERDSFAREGLYGGQGLLNRTLRTILCPKGKHIRLWLPGKGVPNPVEPSSSGFPRGAYRVDREAGNGTRVLGEWDFSTTRPEIASGYEEERRSFPGLTLPQAGT
jgi:hypothetical protein